MRTASNVVVVRPYRRSIRESVYAALRSAGLRVGGDDEIPAGTPDDAVLCWLEKRSCRALLVPFHAHRDERGELVHGLDLILRIRTEIPRHVTTPILCPISAVGLAAASLVLSRLENDALGPVLFVREDQLGPGLARLVTDFLDAPDATSLASYPPTS